MSDHKAFSMPTCAGLVCCLPDITVYTFPDPIEITNHHHNKTAIVFAVSLGPRNYASVMKFHYVLVFAPVQTRGFSKPKFTFKCNLER